DRAGAPPHPSVHLRGRAALRGPNYCHTSRRERGLPKRLLGALTYQPVSDPRSALDLSGTVALVTGGVRGIGLGITHMFLAAGADVVVCARHEPESLPTVDGRSAVFFPADVRDPE